MQERDTEARGRKGKAGRGNGNEPGNWILRREAEDVML